MNISDAIKKEAAKNNILGVRINILNEIVLYADIGHYKEILEFIELEEINIFEENDNSDEIKLNKDEWTEDYLISLRTDLSFNFSRKRLDHFNDVAVYLYGDKVRKMNEAKKKEETRPQKTSYEYKEKDNSSPRPKTSNKKPVYVNQNNSIYRLMLLVAIGIGAFFLIFKIIKNILD